MPCICRCNCFQILGQTSKPCVHSSCSSAMHPSCPASNQTYRHNNTTLHHPPSHTVSDPIPRTLGPKGGGPKASNTSVPNSLSWSTIIPRPFAPALAQTPAPSRRPSPAHHPTRSKTSIQDNNRLCHSIPYDGNLFSPFPLRRNIALLWALALAPISAILIPKRNDSCSSSQRLFQLPARARASIKPLDSITASTSVSS